MSQLSTFHVGRYLLGVDVALVQEVVRLAQMTPVPLSCPEIAGLINLRGEVLTAVDLRARIGLPPAGTDHGRARKDRINIVIRVDEEPVSLIVDEIGGVQEVAQVPFETTPSTVDANVRELLLGAYTLPDRLLLALDCHRTLQLTEEARAA